MPYPRQLTATESLDTLTHWKSHVRNYFRRDDNVRGFFARDKTWDPALQNYGFVGEEAATQADHLEGLLDTISGFMPGPYLTARLTKHTKSMQDVFNVIWQHYDVNPNPDTFLDFADLSLQSSERYIDLYYRMLYHMEMHLLKTGDQDQGIPRTDNEIMTTSHKNLIALNWIQAISPSLLTIVRLEKHKELKDGMHLVDMVSDIAKNVDEWLKRHGAKLPSRSKEETVPEATVRNLRLDSYSDFSTRGTPRGQYRGRGYRPSRGPRNNFNRSRVPSTGFQNTEARKFCPGCNFLATELHLDVNFRHLPAECPRKRSVMRMLQAAELELDEELDCEQDDQQEYVDDQAQEDNCPQGSPYQNKSKVFKNDKNMSPCQNLVFKVWKAQSPSVDVILNNKSISAIIDEGSEVSAIDKCIADTLHIPIRRTIEAAQAAGSKNLTIIGETKEDVIVFIYVEKTVVRWNLGQCLVVAQLGCDMLIGEPAKATNHIQTNPVNKCIDTVDIHKNKVVLSYAHTSIYSDVVSDQVSNNAGRICQNPTTVRLSRSENVYPKETVFIDVPKPLRSESEILIETTKNSNFPAPGIYSVNHSKVKFENVGPQVCRLYDNDLLYMSALENSASLSKWSTCHNEDDNHVAYSPNLYNIKDDLQSRHMSQSRFMKDDITIHLKGKKAQAIQHDTDNGNNATSLMKKVYDVNNKTMSQFQYPDRSYDYTDQPSLSKVSIDPDNRLSQRAKTMFSDIITSFSDIVTDIPGRYNGFFGQVTCSLTMSGSPPPSLKPRIPSYSSEKLKILADLLDDMERWGVIVKPETIGVVPTHIHPCILVPKENDKYRLVTDFKSIQNYILPLPTVMPTVDEAMKALASADFHVELDFSNYYWQNPIPREDSAKLAVAHPYGGLRVYTVCPQGLRNSAEWGSEILARIYGDMVRQNKCTRIADQIYVLGNSVIELSENLKMVMQRARNSNLTFKASKIIVCPASTVILGWKKHFSQWIPTNHVMSPLSAAEPPSTVKKMRGWLGAYRQIAKTIPGHAIVLQPFEKMVGGKNSRDKIEWSPDLLEKFDKAKQSIQTVQPITIPRPSDQLRIYTDWSQHADAVGGRLVVIREIDGKKVEMHGGQFSARLKGAQARWTPCEKECLAIKLLTLHFQPFIRESKSKTTIFTDNIVSVHAWNAIKLGKVSSSSRVASFISTMCESNIEIVHFPGSQTMLADYNSRNPMSCNESKCQTCRFIEQEIDAHENYVRFSQTLRPNIVLTTRSTWLNIQKDDSTLSQLFRLIKTGLNPERKSRNKSLKLLHNLYRRGILYVANDGLLQYKLTDLVHNIAYEAIVVPEVYISSIVQSLHLKLDHPSAYQLHKVMSRHYFAIGLAKVVSTVTAACDTCARLKTLPKEAQKNTTSKNKTFGSAFSADVLLEKGQKILLCREKLSQFTTTAFIQDETKDAIQEGIVTSILTLVPETGAVIQVDPGPGLVALASDKNSILAGYNISLDIGRTHNKQKNPIAENAIKEFRKEWLRLKPSGEPLTENERARITDTINKRIRLNGVAPKEFALKRTTYDHAPIQIDDAAEGDLQFRRRQQANEAQFIRDSTKKPIPSQNVFKPGDLVYIKSDLSKSRGREQHIVVQTYVKGNDQWLIVKKCQASFRNKGYLVKSSEVYLAPSSITSDEFEIESVTEMDNENGFHGFRENISISKRDKIKHMIDEMNASIPSAPRQRGRPTKHQQCRPLDEDIRVDEDDELLVGFPDDSADQSKSMRDKIKGIIKQLKEEDYTYSQVEGQFHGFEEQETTQAEQKKSKLENMLNTLQRVKLKIRMSKAKLQIPKYESRYAWNYDQWMKILDEDDLDEQMSFMHVPRLGNQELEVSVHESLEEDDMFMSAGSALDQTAASYMHENQVTTVEDFNVQFERFQSLTSTPIKQQLVSLTDPTLLDKIPIFSTSSESSLENFDDNSLFTDNVFNDAFEGDIHEPISQGPVRLQQILEDIHADQPEMSEPIPNKVYRMDDILQNIEEHQTDIQESVTSSRPKRNIERPNYKLLNEGGAVSRRK